MGTAIDETLSAFATEVGAEDPITVVGSGTHGDLGGAVDPDARVVKAPVGIISYEPEEMTITVRAGTSVAEMHGVLAEHGQITALPEQGTVGGALATGFDGIARLGRGQCRDALLQVRYISAEGKVISGGAPVVKNVSGFDLPRLMVGSLGTLGVLAEVTLRTNPLPAHQRVIQAEVPDPFAVIDLVRRPQFVLWDGTTTWVGLGGHEPTVAAEFEALGQLGHWEEATDLPAFPRYRWSLSPAELRNLATPTSANSLSTGDFVASIGVGTVFATNPAPIRKVSRAVAGLCQRMKAEFDPNGRLNPGRSVLNGDVS